MITDEMKVAAVKAYTEVDGKCRPAAMQKALEAALPFLPIAGEGKAPVGYAYEPEIRLNKQGFFVSFENRDRYDMPVYLGTPPTHNEARITPHQFAQEYEFRGDTDYTPNDGERTMIEDAIMSFIAVSLSPSSPGKDGGQEVEAVGNAVHVVIYAEGDHENTPAEAVHHMLSRAYEREGNFSWCDDTQPASTALVEKGGSDD